MPKTGSWSQRLASPGIEQLDVPASREALTWLLGFTDRLSARLMAAVGDFNTGEAWRDDGATSMTAWIRHEGRATRRDASRLVSTARRLRDLPTTATAHRDGALSNGQLQAIQAADLQEGIRAAMRRRPPGFAVDVVNRGRGRSGR